MSSNNATSNIQYKGLQHLPRSVTWRLRLGLLQWPTSSPPSLADHGSASAPTSLQEVVQWNLQSLQDEQAQYEQWQASYGHHFLSTEENTEKTAAAADDDITQDEDDDPLQVSPQQQQEQNTQPLVDPLTGFLLEQQAQEDRRQELDLRYRTERARRKRGIVGDEDDTATTGAANGATAENNEDKKKIDRETLNIIHKDLLRLPCPDTSDLNLGVRQQQQDGAQGLWETDQEKQTWLDALTEILYFFALENPNIGYRQGMHEVASYLWLVLEIDRRQYAYESESGMATFDTTDDQNIGNNSNTNSKTAQAQLLLFGRSAANTILRSMLGSVRQAFDVKVASNSRPLEDMAFSILAKINLHYTHQGQHNALCPFLQRLSVPPQLYCTKQVRLLFSREVVGAFNVITLWDVFIELVSEGWEWMAIMETTAASRILLYRDQLLSPLPPPGAAAESSNGGHDNSPAAQQHRAMDLLMNMPPLQDIEPLVKQVNHLLELQKYQHILPPVPPRDESSMSIPNNYVLYNGSDPTVQQYQQHHHQQHHHQQHLQHQHYHQNGPLGGDIMGAFSLRDVRQSLKQGVERLSTSGDTWKERLSTSGDTWKKRVVEEWNGLTIQPPGNVTQPSPMPQQQGGAPGFYREHPTLFADNSNSIPLQACSPLQQSQAFQQQPQTQPPLDIHTSLELSTLADRLGTSGAVLQDFVMTIARTPDLAQQQPPHAMNSCVSRSESATSPDAMSPSPKVPSAVWEALAEIEQIRTVLVQQQQQ